MLVVGTLLFLTPLFYHLPKTALSAIIITALSNLFDYKEFIYLWRNNKWDFLIITSTFFGVLFLGIEYGLFLGIALALLFLVIRMSLPKMTFLGLKKDQNGKAIFVDVERYEEAETYPGIFIVKMHQSLLFVNSERFKDCILSFVPHNPRVIIIDFSCCNDIDGAA